MYDESFSITFKEEEWETYFESSIVGHSMVNPEHSGSDIVANHNIDSVMSSR